MARCDDRKSLGRTSGTAGYCRCCILCAVYEDMITMERDCEWRRRHDKSSRRRVQILMEQER